MTGVPRHIAEHRLNIREGCLPIRQKKRGPALERNKAIQKEVEKLVDAGIMKEVHYHSCPGYHQIKMAKENEEKTTFITSQGIFCNSKMLFGLKNAEATYQCLVDRAFQKQIGRNLEVYVDDLVIKSLMEEEIIQVIEETFKILRQINMKLNQKKCTFGIQEGMFLCYKVNADGLKVCPDKADAVLSFPSPRCLKDVQKLNEKLASLNRFMSKSAEKSLPFFKTMKKCTKKGDFQWTQEAEVAFKQMKKLIAELLMLTAPKEKEELIMYLAAAKEAISAVLMTERGGKQLPVYFMSRTLRGPEINYTPMEKLVLALLSASRRLKRYDIQYRPRTSIKGQVLADFIVERPDEESPDELMAEPEELPEPWTLFTDGSSCIDGSGAELILTNPEGVEFTYARRFMFEATNNEADKPSQWLLRSKGVSKNKKADALSKIASTSFSYLSKQVLVEELKEKSIHEKEVLAIPFYKWGIDIAGPFPEGPGKVKFLIVAIDYFTKWIEAKLVATITGNQVKNIVWDNIVCRFGLPGEIVSDNGKQFRDNPFKDWCEKLCIRQCFASVKHPQANGLVERANRSLGEGIKARLDERKTRATMF
ncbi:reverse transcriptase domain-containing protein [Tanacetum coccineum]|uniref:Reverse transcriptase domain-containing protein n=1 Tax=Tanacetum coccineum TaxID=301880 RepID=A0ABQ4XL61_9ASTR